MIESSTKQLIIEIRAVAKTVAVKLDQTYVVQCNKPT